jgi:2-hydroxychromene-2-carboxylate isomerase
MSLTAMSPPAMHPPTSALELHFYYDFVCPYAYLASLSIERASEDGGASLVYKPILLGGVFRAIGAPDSPRMSPPRVRYGAIDLARQAVRAGAPLSQPSGHPRRTVLALRAALGSGNVPRASRALFDAYWARGEDLESPAVVRAALDNAGLDGQAALAKSGDPAIKDALRQNTEDAVRLGVFGVPSFVVLGPDGAELFWGNDRLHFVERSLRRDSSVAPEHEHERPSGKQSESLPFYFDFSSPFAYLASTQVRKLAKRTGARLEYKPILLGGLFKAIGTSNVPLFDMPMPKQQHTGVDLDRWARFWGVPFRFTSHFPLNTTKPLRVVLLAPEEKRPDLVDALFRAAWAEDRDISNDAVLGEVLKGAGCDAPQILAAARGEEVKTALREATEEAEKRGVFGVPTFFVKGDMYWGQDRLDIVEQALSHS